MPEYLAPGVYVEETSFRSKSIEGVSTTTTGFIGPTRYGPVKLDLDIVTSLGEFERTYGDGEPLVFGELEMPNFMWHAARAFFTEGGKRLYVSRVFLSKDDASRTAGPTGAPSARDTGHASLNVGRVRFRARHEGAYGSFTLRLTVKAGPNVLGGRRDTPGGPVAPTLGALSDRDLVWIGHTAVSPLSVPSFSDVALAERDQTRTPFAWRFRYAVGSPIAGSPVADVDVSDLNADPTPGQGDAIRVVTLTLEVLDGAGRSLGTWRDLPLDPSHRTGGLADSIFAVFGDEPEQRALPIVVTTTDAGLSALDVLADLFASYDRAANDFADGDDLVAGIVRTVTLDPGNDGHRPGMTEYGGRDDLAELTKTGLKQFEAIDDISIVAAPGSTWNYAQYRDDANAITGLLLAHAADMRYRIAVLDSAQNQSIADVRKMRAKLDSKYGALYFPWVRVLDPITRQPTTLPPSGFVAGIYARNDINRAVYKAPANEVVNLALGFELTITKAQQEVMNPEGVNCFRFFEGRGMLLWGARTVSSDPEWKYVNIRRYFIYLEHSIDRGTQWAVFEPNGERLWANVRRTIEDFLLNEWQMGALLGDKPEKAYFVRCDRSTMTQNDIDNGRLVCLVGVAPLTPAEFVIFRIGQWTADRKV